MPALAKPAARPVKTAAVAPKPKPVAAKPKAAGAGAAHPTYFEMIKEGISALKDRTGSSSVAIAKYIEEKHAKSLPANFKKMLFVQLRANAAAAPHRRRICASPPPTMPPTQPCIAAHDRFPDAAGELFFLDVSRSLINAQHRRMKRLHPRRRRLSQQRRLNQRGSVQ